MYIHTFSNETIHFIFKVFGEKNVSVHTKLKCIQLECNQIKEKGESSTEKEIEKRIDVVVIFVILQTNK